MSIMLIEKYSLSLGKTIAIIVVSVIIPIAIGMIGAVSSGIAYTKFIPNMIGVILGLLLFMVVVRLQKHVCKYTFELTLFALACMISTLFHDGIEGVFRWLIVGPLHINISSIIIPLILYNYFTFEKINPYKASIPVIIASLILVFQPDAGQSLALIFGLLPFLPTVITIRKIAVFWALLIFLSTIVWFQADPLEPVQYVENIFALIANAPYLGKALVVVAAVSIFIPVVIIGDLTSKLTLSILLYFLGGLLATLFGHFPVHIIGAGISPVLGMLLAISLLYSERRST